MNQKIFKYLCFSSISAMFFVLFMGWSFFFYSNGYTEFTLLFLSIKTLIFSLLVFLMFYIYIFLSCGILIFYFFKKNVGLNNFQFWKKCALFIFFMEIFFLIFLKYILSTHISNFENRDYLYLVFTSFGSLFIFCFTFKKQSKNEILKTKKNNFIVFLGFIVFVAVFLISGYWFSRHHIDLGFLPDYRQYFLDKYFDNL